MSIGLILLIIVGLLVAFGVAQRVLDRLRLTDRQALLFVGLLFVGGLIPDIPITPLLSVNIGGALVPLGLCVYLLVKAGSAKEVVRALLASVITGVAIHLVGEWMPSEPEQIVIDPNYLFGLIGGAVAYLFGRSRRGHRAICGHPGTSFVAGVLGSMIAAFWDAIEVWNQGVRQALSLGGAGLLDTIVISGLVAVLLAELVGELVERMSRGARRDEERVFEEGDFVKRGERK